MLASRILSELNVLMTLRSKAAGRDKDQLGTRTSAGSNAVLTTKVAALFNFGSKTCDLAEVC